MKRAAVIAGFLLLSFASAAPVAHAEDALAPPADSKLLLDARADGVQVYLCTAKDNGFAWVLDGPAASLFDDHGRQIGLHGKGPIWTLGDGSAVSGEVMAKQDAPKAGAIPWLLLKVKTHAGDFGTLTNAGYVRRVDTIGGVAPPDGCDGARLGDFARMRYSAVYQFYGQ